jgi:hypothetical protein
MGALLPLMGVAEYNLSKLSGVFVSIFSLCVDISFFFMILKK